MLIDVNKNFHILQQNLCYRIACTNHALSNNLKYGVTKSDMNSLLFKTICLLKTLKNKQQSCDILKDNNAKIILPPPTRWSYYYDAINNLLKIRDAVSSACIAVGMDNLANSEYEQLAAILPILAKYKSFIAKLESRGAKLSKVVPLLSVLRKFLSQQVSFLTKPFCSKLIEDFDKRFAYVFNPGCVEFSNVFLIATALNIDQRKYLKIPLLDKEKKFIESYLIKCTKQPTNTDLIEMDEEFPELAGETASNLEVESEYSRFSQSICVVDNDSFWGEAKSKLPILYEAHCQIQSGSPTSCDIESAFSYAAQSAGVKGRRSRLTLMNLEKEGVIKYNKNIKYFG